MKPLFALLLLFYTSVLSSCKDKQIAGAEEYSHPVYKQTHADTPVIFLQPIGNISAQNIKTVINEVKGFYGYKCVVRNNTTFTPDLLAKSKSRYDANKILKKFAGTTNMLILTDRDIAHKNEKRNIDEWGIFGLGLRPGKTCVVSTFRLRKNADEALFKQRLAKICLHEIGHNLGLDHCTSNSDCLMNDAAGSIKTVDKERMILCNRCRSILKNKQI